MNKPIITRILAISIDHYSKNASGLWLSKLFASKQNSPTVRFLITLFLYYFLGDFAL
jgi:hypothetical protein